MRSGVENSQRASETLNTLPPNISSTRLVCPLCGAYAPARGLRARTEVEAASPIWQLVFTCPACGLVSVFDTHNLSIKKIKALNGSNWTNELRHLMWTLRVEQSARERAASPRHFASVLVVSFIVWIVLTGSFFPIDVFWGLVVSAVVARFSYRFVAFELPHWILQPRRWLYFFDLVIELVSQLVKQNLSLSLRVLKPELQIKPGIVAVPTKLRGDINLTLLGSLMSLTPDTVTMDIDEQAGMIYVHWIDVQTTDPLEAQKLISGDLEERIIRWLL
jgi:multicomponent Na+:H+ antiporter subunit E